MKIIVRVIIVLIIAVPVFMCWKTLQSVWKEDEFKTPSSSQTTTGEPKTLKEVENLINDEENRVTASNLGDNVKYDITGLNIISKVYENAEVAISLANIYEEHDETSKIVGKLEKGSAITVQNYDNGWSTVTNYTYSGWMKTENIKLPTENTNMVITANTPDGAKTGTVKVSDALNVRETASKEAKVITTLGPDTVVTILDDTTAGWYKIKYNSYTGWVASDYVTVNQ